MAGTEALGCTVEPPPPLHSPPLLSPSYFLLLIHRLAPLALHSGTTACPEGYFADENGQKTSLVGAGDTQIRK